MQETLSTGLENWAQPVLYLAALATATATGITTGRFKASSYSELPTAKAIAATLIFVCGLSVMGAASIGAILMAPTQNPLPTAGLGLTISTLPQIVAIYLRFGSSPHTHTTHELSTPTDAEPTPTEQPHD